MEFKGPKTYKPSSLGQPSPSRNDILKYELGFESESDGENSAGTSDEEPEVDQISNRFTLVQIESLQVEIQQKEKQREELLLQLKALSDKTASYRTKLAKSEQNKKSQLKIMRKTHEIVLNEKDKLIADLEEIISELEKRFAEQDGKKGGKKGKGKKGSSPDLSALHQLVQTITRLHEDKAKLTEELLTAKSAIEDAKNEAQDAAAKHRNEIEDFQLEMKRLKCNSKKYDTSKENVDVNISLNVSRLEEENKNLRREKKDLETQLWQTQEGLKDNIRNLEEEMKTTSKKLRDSEAKYVNLAATPPKVQVRTVSVVSEEIRNRLDEQINKNRELETSLKKAKLENNAKVSNLEKELTSKKGSCENLKTENKKLSSEKNVLLEEVKKIAELRTLLERTENSLDKRENKVREVETIISSEREAHRKEIDNIITKKDAEIVEVKMEAEKTTAGIKKIYESLKGNCFRLLDETRQLYRDYKELKLASQALSSSINPICRAIHKQIVRKIHDVNQENKELVERYVREMKLRKKLHNELVDLKGNIRVYCRVRPLIGEDGEGKQADNVVSFDEKDDGIVMIKNKETIKKFEMEKVFPPVCSQVQVFSEVKNLVISCLDGYNVCIFAYGQTGSGKTYTMEGPTDNPGLNQQALRLLFNTIEERSKDWAYTVSVSVLEVYNETIRDLLSSEPNQKLEIKLGKEGHHVPGLTDVRVHDIDHVNELFALGKKNRATATTNMNEHSSRSHAILRIKVVGSHNATHATVTGKLNLIDLAGSERVGKSGSEGLRMKEAQNINKSLSSLGDVIHALKNKQSHVPYRNSKLTFLLQDSLGGDSKTLMVVQISPVVKNVGETICSLTFAQRVRTVELGQATRKVENNERKESECSPKKAGKFSNVTCRR